MIPSYYSKAFNYMSRKYQCRLHYVVYTLDQKCKKKNASELLGRVRGRERINGWEGA